MAQEFCTPGGAVVIVVVEANGTVVLKNPDNTVFNGDQNTLEPCCCADPTDAFRSVISDVVPGHLIAKHFDGDALTANINETVTTIVNNGDGSSTYTNENGIAITIPADIVTNIVDNGNGVFTYTNEAGVAQVVTIPITGPSVVTNVIAGNRIGTHNDGDGTIVDIDETITTLVDNVGSFTYTSEDGTVTTVTPADSKSSITATVAGHLIANHNDGTGVITPINETVSTLADNGDGSFTYTNENGIVTNIPAPVAGGQVTFTDSEADSLAGTAFTFAKEIQIAQPASERQIPLNQIGVAALESQIRDTGLGNSETYHDKAKIATAGNSSIDAASRNVSVIASDDAFISGGARRSSIIGSSLSSIDSGLSNSIIGVFVGSISGGTTGAAIVGGTNQINNAARGFIGGGNNNTLVSGALDAAIVGGQENTIGNADRSGIFGGQENTITNNAQWSIIAGGGGPAEGNIIASNRGFIGATSSSAINVGSANSYVLGGLSNIVDTGSTGSGVLGGRSNNVRRKDDSVIIGGSGNTINPSGAGIFGNSHMIAASDNCTISVVALSPRKAAVIASETCDIGDGFESAIIASNGSDLNDNDNSAIVGGTNNTSTGAFNRSVILGGNAQSIVGDNTVYVPNLAINQGTGINAIPVNSADAVGTNGSITIDNDFIYVKTPAGWKQVALSLF